MNKNEFLENLHKSLSGLPKEEIAQRLNFYSEIIDDLMEEGMSEEEAVSKIGSVDEISEQIIDDIPLGKLVKEKIKPTHTLKTWEIVLLVVGSPVWFPLLIAVVAVVFSMYIVLWSLIITLWSVFASALATALAFGGFVSSSNFMVGDIVSGFAAIGAGLILLGLSVFLFFGCKEATKGISLLTKKAVLWIKKCFVKKEAE